MQVIFNETYLCDLYHKGKSSNKKHRYQPNVIRGYQKAIKFLIAAQKIEDLYPIHSLNFEALVGDKAGTYSVRANAQYRVEFTVTETQESVVTICNILSLSNHYK